MSAPVPFELTATSLHKVASNGTSTLLVDVAGELIRRRAISMTSQPPVGERVLPQLNELAGDVLRDMEMPPDTLRARLEAIINQLTPPPQRRKEWTKATLEGVNVFFDGSTVIVTKEDLWP